MRCNAAMGPQGYRPAFISRLCFHPSIVYCTSCSTTYQHTYIHSVPTLTLEYLRCDSWESGGNDVSRASWNTSRVTKTSEYLDAGISAGHARCSTNFDKLSNLSSAERVGSRVNPESERLLEWPMAAYTTYNHHISVPEDNWRAVGRKPCWESPPRSIRTRQLFSKRLQSDQKAEQRSSKYSLWRPSKSPAQCSKLQFFGIATVFVRWLPW